MYDSRQYQGMSDEQLLEELNRGDAQIVDYLLEKYKNFVRKKARTMYLVGGDNEDLMQEGMIGLYKAIRDYDREKELSFLSFANLCITRQLHTAVHTSLRKKHGPLNSYISFYDAQPEGDRGTKERSISYASNNHNPEELLIDKEQVITIMGEIEKTLSSYEQKVLHMYIDGLSYQQIAEELGKSRKSIDNALQRIKKKLNVIV